MNHTILIFVLYARQKRDLSIALSLSDCLGPKMGTSIFVRVAKLLRLSIDTNIPSKKSAHLGFRVNFVLTRYDCPYCFHILLLKEII